MFELIISITIWSICIIRTSSYAIYELKEKNIVGGISVFTIMIVGAIIEMSEIIS